MIGVGHLTPIKTLVLRYRGFGVYDILTDISDRQRRLSQSTQRRTILDACEYADLR